MGLGVALSLVLSEGVIRIAASLSGRVMSALTGVPEQPVGYADDQMAYRSNLDHPEHDDKGFRNSRVPATADIVVLGDSMSYGSGVRPPEAWPQQLASLSGLDAYNMAFPGWGPAQSLLEFDAALAMNPKFIVQSIYAGNDLFDTFHLVHVLERLPQLKTAGPRTDERLAALEAESPIMGRARHAFGMDQPFRLREWFLLYQLARRLYNEVGPQLRIAPSPWESGRRWCSAQPDCEVFDDEGRRTIFLVGYRLIGLDFDDPRIVEGERLIHAVLGEMDRRARDKGVEFVVLFIPTKELVYSRTADLSRSSENFRKIVGTESGFWERLGGTLDARSIRWLDALHPLQEALLLGTAPYPESSDGHPNAAGQNVIARHVLDGLERELGKGEPDRNL